MATFKVVGYNDEVVNVDILGDIKTVGTILELDEDVAAPLVEEGKLVPLGDTSSVSDSQQPAEDTGAATDESAVPAQPEGGDDVAPAASEAPAEEVAAQAPEAGAATE